MSRRAQVDESAVLDMYRSGVSMETTRRRFGISKARCKGILRNAGETIRDRRSYLPGHRHSRRFWFTYDELYDLYVVQGLSINRIRKLKDCTTVQWHLKHHGIPLRDRQKLPEVECPPEDAAYAAGFFDGEGSINILRRPGNSMCLAVCAAQLSVEPLEFIRSRWGGSIRQEKKDGKTIWKWSSGSALGARFLRSVAPFLIVKREQARIAVEFQSTKRPGRRLSEEDISKEQEARFAVCRLRNNTAAFAARLSYGDQHVTG